MKLSRARPPLPAAYQFTMPRVCLSIRIYTYIALFQVSPRPTLGILAQNDHSVKSFLNANETHLPLDSHSHLSKQAQARLRQ